MVYDQTCTGRFGVGLTHSWRLGGPLYGAMGHLHAWKGASSWAQALDWLAHVRDSEPIQEIQFWGHGRWGNARVAGEVFDASALAADHAHQRFLRPIRERLLPSGQWWFRTCETLGARTGQDFAQRFADYLGCAVAGHTYIIGPWQSGLHRLQPGNAPHWSAWEGLRAGTPEAPQRAFWSMPGCPNTVSCLASTIPEGW
ncbi:MAG: DUF4347 domain-containing protein [Myxococcales bacterium]|nr:DUF4347 domain-containing protein [Myxococcales bacterium]